MTCSEAILNLVNLRSIMHSNYDPMEDLHLLVLETSPMNVKVVVVGGATWGDCMDSLPEYMSLLLDLYVVGTRWDDNDVEELKYYVPMGDPVLEEE